jgi:nicotinamide-nucleotide amidase
MHAIILAIGDELVLGQTVDTNSPYLSAQLVRRGISTLYHQVVADDLAAISTALRQAMATAPLVIVTGGLGPTDDDLTRQALADALGVPLVEDAAALEHLMTYYRGRGVPMPPRNKVQALCPRGCGLIPNSCGTAPGMKAIAGKTTLYVTPGVPSEMFAMFERSIAPELDAQTVGQRAVILTEKINTFGLAESVLADRLGNLMDRARNPKVGTTVAGGIVAVRVRSEFPDKDQAQAEMDTTIAEVERRLQPLVYGRGDQTLQDAAVAMLRSCGVTLATAESCTGGLLGKMVTDVPGSSAVYLGGLVTYANALKISELGVPAEMIEQHGAVSAEVARAMALGVVRQTGADLALSVTGIAGPDGGTADKPVGLVYLGLADRRRGDDWAQVMRLDLAWSRSREAIRDRAAKSALQALRLHLMQVPIDQLFWSRREQEPVSQSRV